MPRKPIGKLSPETARKLLEKYQATDPCVVFPRDFAGPTSLAYLKSQSRYAVLHAASRTGKTTTLQCETAMLLRRKHPWKQYDGIVRILLVITRTDQAASVWGDRLLKRCCLPGEIGNYPWIPAREVAKVHTRPSQKYGPYPAKIDMKNGNEYYLALAGDPDSWQSLEGLEFEYIIRDEATGNENLSDELDTRLWGPRTTGEKLGQCWLGGLRWGATETKDNEEFRKFKKRCEDGEAFHEYFRLDISENKSVSAAVRMQASVAMSKEAYEVRALGVGSIADRIRIFAPYWDDERHIRKTPYEIKTDDNLWLGFDPGWRDNCGIACIAISRDDPWRLRLVRWLSYRRGGYSKAVADMKEWLDGRQAVTCVCDKAMIGKKQDTGESFYTAFMREVDAQGVQFIRPPIYGDNRIDTGIMRIQQVLSNVDRRDEQSFEVDPTGDGCIRFVESINRYRWKVNANGDVLRETIQKDVEAPDVLRYITSRKPCWEDFGHQSPKSVIEAPKNEYFGLSDDEIMHRERLAESGRMLDAENIGTFEDFSSVPCLTLR